MICDIFLKTYAHDDGYHAFCMQSIAKYCSGFRKTVVIRDEDQEPSLNGYLRQQVVKMHADMHTDADIVLITDSDTLFTEPVTPESFMRDGKPVWMITPYDEAMHAHEGLQRWFEVMTEFFGVEPEHEFMRRHPFMIPAWLLKDLREFCWNRHGRTMEQYVFDKGVFSEFNVIGFHAWLHHRDKFYWMDSTNECPPSKLFQAWSHDPIEKNLPKIREILG